MTMAGGLVSKGVSCTFLVLIWYAFLFRVAGTHPDDLPWISVPSSADVITGYTWELYNVEEDPSQAVNLVS